MIDTRYRRLSGKHAGGSYVVIGLYNEIEIPRRWILHNEADEADRPIVAEDELNDPARWLPLR
jgi:hypothetical protein